jgi:hypothetical protein
MKITLDTITLMEQHSENYEVYEQILEYKNFLKL